MTNWKEVDNTIDFKNSAKSKKNYFVMITGGNFLFQGISFTKLLLVEEPLPLKVSKRLEFEKLLTWKRKKVFLSLMTQVKIMKFLFLAKIPWNQPFYYHYQRFCLHILHMEWKKARKVIFYLVTFWSIYMSSSLRVTEFAGNEIPPNYKKERILKYC